MADIHPNFDAVKRGLIEVTPQEKLKLEKDGLDVIHDIYRYAKLGFSAIVEEDFDRLKWYGVYRQKPKDSGYFMMRTKIPGGQLTGDQAILLSELADEFAHGFCDITTRQTIQYHWLRIEDVPPIFDALEKVGIITSGACGDITRNVACCPVSGINPEAILDATPQMLEISRGLTNTKEFSNLPRKYKIGISGCHIHCHQPDINCLGFFGLVNAHGEAGYGVKVGGGLSSSPHLAKTLPVWISPEETWPVAKAISEVYRDEGYRAKRNRARFKFLVADWGAERILAAAESSSRLSAPETQRICFSARPGDRPHGNPRAGPAGSLLGGSYFPRRPHPKRRAGRCWAAGEEILRSRPRLRPSHEQAKPHDPACARSESARDEGRRWTSLDSFMIRLISEKAASPAPASSFAISPWPRPRTG